MGDLIAAPQKAHEGEGVVEMMVETTSNNMETGEKMNVMTDMGKGLHHHHHHHLALRKRSVFQCRDYI